MGAQKVGGVPCGLYLLKRFLPDDKKNRHQMLTAITMILTYVTYLAFVTARIPLILIEVKVMQECKFVGVNVTDPNPWCSKFAFMGNPHLTLAYLCTISLASYAIFLQISGCFADYFNPRYYLSLGCLFGSSFYILYSLTTVWEVKDKHFLVAVLVLEEMAHSTAWPIVLSCCTYWYVGSRMGVVFGLWNSHTALGRLLGVFMVHSCLKKDWGFTFVLPGSFLGVMSIFVFTLLVAHPTDLNKLYQAQPTCKETVDEIVPSWMDSWRSLDYSDAFRVPGVLEFSACMFFGRITDYFCTFWLPKMEQDRLRKVENIFETEIDPTTLANFPYVFGGIVGGMVCGVLKDIYNKAALTCICFYMASLPVTALHMLESNMSHVMRFFSNFILGVFVHGPYILLVSSISYDLSRSPIIRRGHRGIATVAAIIESAGASGAALTPFVNYFVATHQVKRGSVFQIVMLIEMAAGLSLCRMAWRELRAVDHPVPVWKYFFQPSWQKRRPSV